jgi:hypothetical protein
LITGFPDLAPLGLFRRGWRKGGHVAFRDFRTRLAIRPLSIEILEVECVGMQDCDPWTTLDLETRHD